MKLAVRLSAKAALDLEAIVEYYYALSPATARKHYHGILSAIGRLPHFPYLGRIVPEFAEDYLDRYRELIHGNYRIVYRVEPQAIVVVRIVDGRRLLALDA
jgi:toxin ParE1/3/4